MRIDRVYTRGGDQGETSLIGGERVSKADPRIEAYGSIDELNATLGLVVEALASSQAGAHLTPTSGVDAIEKQFRFTWKIVLANGSTLQTGEDQGEAGGSPKSQASRH